jgi:hypothetical protein
MESTVGSERGRGVIKETPAHTLLGFLAFDCEQRKKRNVVAEKVCKMGHDLRFHTWDWHKQRCFYFIVPVDMSIQVEGFHPRS